VRETVRNSTICKLQFEMDDLSVSPEPPPSRVLEHVCSERRQPEDVMVLATSAPIQSLMVGN